METKENKNSNLAVRYNHFGGTDVLYLTELPKPTAGPNQVLVKVKAAGTNPGEASIREGFLQKMFPSTFPSGQGSDFAGIVVAVGTGATKFSTGDEVIGFSIERNSQAEYVVVDESQLILRPEKVTWEQGGSLFVAGTTAYAAVHALLLQPGDVLVVSAAAGGVGSLAVQLAKNIGAEVFGFASESNHEWLTKHGIIPVAYGEDNQKALIAALNGKQVNAFFDASGKGYVELAINMGVPKDRINTIIDFEAAGKYGVKTAGSAQATSTDVLDELAGMIADGKLEMIVAKTYPLAQVKQAYEELEQKHTHGKIVLIP